MSLSLGEKLRQAREERGISISEVAEQTRISPLYLKSIEKDDYKPLPGGIFNKGFVRSYARYIGFDEDEALQDYISLVSTNDEVADSDQRVYRPEVLSDDSSIRSMAPSILLGSLILLLAISGIALLVSYLVNRPASSATAVNTNTAAANNTAANANQNRAVTPAGNAPTMGGVKIEFSTTGDDISLSSVVDGKPVDQLVTMSKPASFAPIESLHLKYAKSRAANAHLTIADKPITLPQTPVNPRREPIEFDITKDNIQQIWQSGEVKFDLPHLEVPVATATPRPSVKPTVKPSLPPNVNSNVVITVPKPSLPPVNAKPKKTPFQ